MKAEGKVYHQRELLVVLKRLIADASASIPTAGRDKARRELRETLAANNWQTVYILTNLAAKRCRFLRAQGYPVPWSYTHAQPGDVDRLEQSKDRER